MKPLELAFLRRTWRFALGFALASILVNVWSYPALARNPEPPQNRYHYKVLHTFTYDGSGGSILYAPVTRDATGNLYGVTTYGGNTGLGVVFKLDSKGNETVLHSFAGYPDDGAYPQTPVILDEAGNIFGLTPSGGNHTGCGGVYFCGTVFKLDSSGTETVLYDFTGGLDGANPDGYPVWDGNGSLASTTQWGGTSFWGTLFKFDSDRHETVLHNFTGGLDGGSPAGGLIRDEQGNLYGITFYGGIYGDGVVFQLRSDGEFSVLHSFAGRYTRDGMYPLGTLSRDGKGNLYGTTLEGGAGPCVGGCGTIFKIDKAGRETVLHRFRGSDGRQWPYGGVVIDKAGNLYGTTSGDCCYSQCGTIFRLDNKGKFTILHSFGDGTQGAVPEAGLILDEKGNLYGTTLGGPGAGGTVFVLERR